MRLFLILNLMIYLVQLNLAQSPAHVDGEIILTFDKGYGPDDLWKTLSDEGLMKSRQSFNLLQKRTGPIEWWHMKFDSRQLDELRLLQKVRSHKGVGMAQFNHLIKPRLLPDDPLVTNQWQYVNDGSSGGKEDADLDMDEAWDLATGGITANGDTIVVCIIDGGMDPDHQDFGNNLWVNYAEIPENGVDDDGNGFLDDYHGWNVSNANSNDNVFYGGSHGTPVAGIVGAKGNNGIGVSGVNWNVKLMIVKGGGNEAEALEAYHYPYVMRKRYNDTQGQEGAFVVVTNASWGTDQLSWEDAPIWCAFYDTLGAVGILNCGATANKNFNIDVVGDMPTSCPSDYLLTVTNMNRSDEKVFSAGYGSESIDLGAFGDGTYTTKLGNSYGSFSGTSGATPHVAGAVALAYSLDCSKLADLAMEKPSQAALLVKEIILAGVDPNESLQDITVTGGRLNVHNSLIYLDGICSECTFPLNVNTDSIGADLAMFSWEMDADTNKYDLIFRQKDEDTWDSLFSVQSPVMLTNLTPCTDYQFKLKKLCDNDPGQFSFAYSFTTDGCCILPESHQLVLGQDSFHILLNDILATDTYLFEYKRFGESEWQTITSLGPELSLPSLEACAYYMYRFQSICASEQSEFSAVFQAGFPCGECEVTAECVPPLSNSFEFIERIELGDFVNVTGPEKNAYSSFDLGSAGTLQAGRKYPVSLKPGFYVNGTGDTVKYDEFFRIYADIDLDGSLAAEEKIFEAFSQGGESVNEVLTMPKLISSGHSKLRVIMGFKDFNEPCPQSLIYGETEDYCIQLDGQISDCLLNGTEIEQIELISEGVRLEWTAPDGVDSYLYGYRKQGSADWMTGSTDLNYLVLSSLDSCETYEFKLVPHCVEGEGDVYGPVSFETDCFTVVSDINADQSPLSIYPNPFYSQLKIQIPDFGNAEILRLTILDPLGTVIYQQAGPLPVSGDECIIRSDYMNQWVNGVYLVKLFTSDRLYTGKAFYLGQ